MMNTETSATVLDYVWIKGKKIDLPFTYDYEFYLDSHIPKKSKTQILEEIVCRFANLYGENHE